MKKILALLVLVMIGLVWFGIIHSKQAKKDAIESSRDATKPVWEVTATHSDLWLGNWNELSGEKAPAGYIAFWSKPVGTKTFKNIEAISIVADHKSENFDRYIKIKPGDHVYFTFDEDKPDRLRGHPWARYFRLWMVVPKEVQKDLPGDFRKHSEYRYYPW